MPAPTPFVQFVIETFSPLGGITVRFMMGGWCVYADGVVCALIADDEVYLKAAPGGIGRFTERGLKPFRPFPDQATVMKYYQAPPEIYEDPDALRLWAGAAIAAGRAAKRPKKAARKAVSQRRA